MKLLLLISCLLISFCPYAQNCGVEWDSTYAPNSYFLKNEIAGKEDSLKTKAWLNILKTPTGIFLFGSYSLPPDTSRNLTIGPCGKPVGVYYLISFADGETYRYDDPPHLQPRSIMTIFINGFESYRRGIRKPIKVHGDTVLLAKLAEKPIRNIKYMEPWIWRKGSDTPLSYKTRFSITIQDAEAKRLQSLVNCLVNQR